MNNWKETTLDKITTIIMGQSPASESYNFIGDGLPFYQGVTEFGDKYISVKSFTNSPTKIVDAGSILFSVRAPVGRINFTKNKCCIGRGNAGLIMKNGEQEFLYYLLRYLEKNILKNVTGTVFDSISGIELRKFSVLVPKLKVEQRKISVVLSSLDDKIELLRKQNETLEKIAQTIFKRWFVEFEFPDKNGKPYKLSGGKMIESEFGEIPAGWRVGKIEDLTEKINSGGTPSTKESRYYGGTLNWFLTKELRDNFLFYSDNKITEAGLNNSSAKLFPKNTVVMAIYAAPTVGRLGILVNESTFNQAAVGLVADKKVASYEYIYLLLKYLRNEFNGLANGAAQQNLSVGLVKSFKIIISEKETMWNFKKQVSSIFNKLKNNNSQIQTLSRLRDTLLPKLMSGEVRVK